jgi:membrane-associated protease RseP (regulator of RpoE activity)
MVASFHQLIVAVAMANCIAASVVAQNNGSSSAEDVDHWVGDLGHDQYLRREKANRELIKIGPPSIKPLITAMRSGDLEVMERAFDVITEIANSNTPFEDGGAWDQLDLLATKGTGQRASRAVSALAEIRSYRQRQARRALTDAGIYVGVDEFFRTSLGQIRTIVRIGDQWNADAKSLLWLRWLQGIDIVRIQGKAASPTLMEHVVKIPELNSIAFVDAKVDSTTLEPLKQLPRIQSLEFRYVELSDEFAEILASLPIRTLLELTGTGISADVVESMRQSLPGLQINHGKGGFLGVKWSGVTDVCEIHDVLANSAAESAGLKNGDVIIRVDAAVIKQFEDLQKEITQHIAGDELEIEFLRGGQKKTLKLILGRKDS